VDWLYGLAQPFVWHPGRAAVVAAAFGLLALAFRGSGRRPLLVAAAGWAVFAVLEWMAWRERADIRVDLLVTWPLLCLLTAASLVMWARGQVRARRR
jgi:hypothetical protein